MYLKFGNYSHASGEVVVALTRDGHFVNGMSQGYTERWNITGKYQASTTSALTTGLAALSAAYAVQAQDIGFYNDDNSSTALFLASSTCRGGTRVVQPPHFPQLDHGQYTSYVDYAVLVEGDVLDTRASIMSWHETLAFSGGGPVYAHLQPLNGPAQKQMIYAQTTYKCTQSGSATFLLGFPAYVPLPLFPAALVRSGNPTYDSPDQRSGPPGSPFFTGFRVSWHYDFEDVGPLFDYPSVSPV